jgi:hypothetical protein
MAAEQLENSDPLHALHLELMLHTVSFLNAYDQGGLFYKESILCGILMQSDLAFSFFCTSHLST